jgi:hypothetical protein
MTDHTIEAHFKVEGRARNLTSNGQIRGMTQHFKNFDVTPDGHIVIRNFSVEFREKLQSVLMDESIPFKAILPVMTF